MRQSRLWTWHIFAGLVILILLGLHMLIMHLETVSPPSLNPAGGEGIAWANVVARGKMVFFMVTYILLLGAALFHGLYGLNTIIGELNIGQGFKRFCATALTLLGVALFILGAWAAIAARGAAMKM
jgi:succinate dehydrogenase / fumarate reductase membrane anchor subunit